MNAIRFALVSITSFVAFAGISAKELSDEELRARGGIVWHPDVGSVAVIDSQRDLSKSDIVGFPFYARKFVKLPFSYVQEGGVSVLTADKALVRTKANAAVILVDDLSLPMSLIAVEARWGIMNIAPLKADRPSRAKLLERAAKLFSRTVIQVLGGANQDFESSAMRSVTSLKDLDALKGLGVAQFAVPGLMNHVHHIGIELGYEELYEVACQEGWAPAPTNDFQKAIWEKVHAPPTKPLKIEFDPATQKGKVTK